MMRYFLWIHKVRERMMTSPLIMKEPMVVFRPKCVNSKDHRLKIGVKILERREQQLIIVFDLLSNILIAFIIN